MNQPLALQIARWITAFLAIAHAFGIVMFWSTNQVSALAMPLALTLAALSPPKLAVGVLAAMLVAAGYAFGGVPFLDPLLEWDVRALHFAELLLIALLIAVAVRGPVQGVAR
jgi:hypothetical protein